MATGEPSSPTTSSPPPSSTACSTTQPPSTSRAKATGSKTRRRPASSPQNSPERTEPSPKTTPRGSMRLRATPSAASSRSTTNRPHLGNFQAVLSGDFSVDDDNPLLVRPDQTRLQRPIPHQTLALSAPHR